MHQRLASFIEYATGGKQSEFAEIMGWSPQYLHRLLTGAGGIGIRPVISLLEKFPDLNARWLMLGQGAMIASGTEELKAHLLAVLSLEKYMAVMTPEELRQFTAEGRTAWPKETITRWASALADKESTACDNVKNNMR